MRYFKKYLWLLAGILLCPYFSMAQDTLSLDRQVLASAGDDVFTDGFLFSYTLGETAVQTWEGDFNGDELVLTEGFHQPDAMYIPPLDTGFVRSTKAQCPDVENGSITVSVKGCIGPYTATLIGNGDTTLITDISGPCGGNDLDPCVTFNNLDSGLYSVTLRGVSLCAFQVEKRVEMKNPDCNAGYYSGITPNGDGKNDVWLIDNIELNTVNKVRIFSRWGNTVWEGTNYDNETVVFEGKSDNGQDVPEGTYFFTIEIPDNPGATRSGWIQILR
jgi:gliding motility-associated-like protein